MKGAEACGARGRGPAEGHGAQRRRVPDLIARALAAEPRVLLLDEPTASLDPKFQLEILRLVGRLAAERGILVVATFHDLAQAYRHSHKVIMMRGGRIYALGPPGEVLTPENIWQVYGVKVVVSREHRAVLVE